MAAPPAQNLVWKREGGVPSATKATVSVRKQALRDNMNSQIGALRRQLENPDCGEAELARICAFIVRLEVQLAELESRDLEPGQSAAFPVIETESHAQKAGSKPGPTGVCPREVPVPYRSVKSIKREIEHTKRELSSPGTRSAEREALHHRLAYLYERLSNTPKSLKLESEAAQKLAADKRAADEKRVELKRKRSALRQKYTVQSMTVRSKLQSCTDGKAKLQLQELLGAMQSKIEELDSQDALARRRKKTKTVAGRENTIARRIARGSCSVDAGQIPTMSARREEVNETVGYSQECVNASQCSADTQNQVNVGKGVKGLPEHLEHSLDHWTESRRERLSSLACFLDEGGSEDSEGLDPYEDAGEDDDSSASKALENDEATGDETINWVSEARPSHSLRPIATVAAGSPYRWATSNQRPRLKTAPRPTSTHRLIIRPTSAPHLLRADSDLH